MTSEAKIEVVADAQKLSRMAAEQFVQLAVAALREKDLFTVALSGGSTPRNVYAKLANQNEPLRDQLSWKKIHFFWGDERHVPPDHPDSNYHMAREAMLERAAVPTENVHRIKSENTDAAQAADEYEQMLREFFTLKAEQLPRFDLILLGMGPDGHTASIFPGTDVINERHRLVAAPWIEKFNSYRITLTPPVLNNAASVIFIVSGADKAKSLREVLQDVYQPARFPAQLIRPSNGKLLWLVDQEAASFL